MSVFQYDMLDVTRSQKFHVNMGPVLTGYEPMDVSCHSFGVCETVYSKNEMNCLVSRIFTRQRRHPDKLLFFFMHVSLHFVNFNIWCNTTTFLYSFLFIW